MLLKRMTKGALSPLLNHSRLLDRRATELVGARPAWLILTYHRISLSAAEDPFGLGMCVHKDHFVNQLQWLKSRFDVWPAHAVIDAMESGEPLPDKLLSITFDDGYSDNLIAADVLDELQLGWTLFVPTEPVRTGQAFWWDRIIAAVQATGRRTLDLDALDIPGLNGTLPIAGFGRRKAVERLLGIVWTLQEEAVDTTVKRLLDALGEVEDHPAIGRPLTPAAVAELSRNGVEIGAHGMRHARLSVLEPDRLEEEIDGSRRELEEWCGAPIRGFAYPGGYCSEAARQQVRKAGFDYAVTTRRSLNHRFGDRYTLGRLGPGNSKAGQLKLSLALHRPAPRRVGVAPC